MNISWSKKRIFLNSSLAAVLSLYGLSATAEPLERAQELVRLGVVAGVSPSATIYANDKMQSEITVFWEFNSSVPEQEITDIRLINRFTGQDIDMEGWDYKNDEGIPNSDNGYLHTIQGSLSKTENNQDISQTYTLDSRNEFPTKAQESEFRYISIENPGVVEFCVEATTASGSIESSCNTSQENSYVALEALAPLAYPASSWSVVSTEHPQANEYATLYTYLDIVNNEPSYPGTADESEDFYHVSESDTLKDYDTYRNAFLLDSQQDDTEAGVTQIGVYLVDSDTESLNLFGLQKSGPFIHWSSTQFFTPSTPAGWAYRLIQIKHFAQDNDSDYHVYYGWDYKGDPNDPEEMRLFFKDTPQRQFVGATDDGSDLLYTNAIFVDFGRDTETFSFRDNYGTEQRVTLSVSLDDIGENVKVTDYDHTDDDISNREMITIR
ncbi:hypothetical protein [Vibrio paucivorans]|uniref:Uncharacterized protein n=1 Tax=Vibrio paucivorans TaxID=2829489 RepID=A0A9X3HU67_9VIBR|nr:hypothetical protein [Vibrio paucivorans]MCW8336324.1 hypothetical protein [Vibrio paucivorans]